MSNCMTQEDAERMDASQAVQILKPLQAMMLDQYGCPISDAYFALGKAIEALKQQTVGAVPVMRCRDCKWYEIEQLKKDGTDDRRYKPSLCVLHNRNFAEDYFCADGERREDGKR